jgi:hypothetical protein
MITGWLRHNSAWLILILVAFIWGWSIGRSNNNTEPIPRVWTPQERPDLSLPPIRFRPPPRIIIAERTGTVVRIDTVRVPVAFDRYRIISNNYLHQDGRTVWIRSFNPETLQFELDRFALRQPKWGRGIWAETGLNSLGGIELGLGAYVRYKAVYGLVGASYDERGVTARIGLRVEL